MNRSTPRTGATSPSKSSPHPMLSLCLSVRQPWAWLIVQGWKNIENREWHTHQRGPILIHAGKTMTEDDYEACRIFIEGFTCLELPPPGSLDRGGIVGAATILDCVTHHSSDWFTGPHGIVLAEQRPLPFHPCRGHQRWFLIPTPPSLLGAASEASQATP